MYIWQISLSTLLFTIIIGLFLRAIAEQSIPRLKYMNWAKQGGKTMKIVRSENWFLFVLLAVEGAIQNLALLTLIISIPLFFVFGI